MTCVQAQFSYQADQTIPVVQGNDTLKMAWAGGLNSAQFNEADLDNDGIGDLVVFDRTNNQVAVFIYKNGSYSYDPDQAYNLPSDITNWLVMRDYNCDGLQDVFTSSVFGMKVYRNMGFTKNLISWELAADPISTLGFNSVINLQMNSSDIPAIEDLDNDGDLDILVYDFASGETVEYHKNLSMETSGDCGQLIYERITKSWGGFRECLCDNFTFGNKPCNHNEGRLTHVAGKSLLAIDLDNDQDKEVLIGQESCIGLVILENKGNPENAIMDEIKFGFPFGATVVDFQFPAVFRIDADKDGMHDLVVAPNSFTNIQDRMDLSASSWLYKNTGTSQAPSFELLKKNFLQHEMIDLGERTSPSFVDVDADGDIDMMLANSGPVQTSSSRGKLTLFRQTGTPVNPAFELSDTDFLGISSLNLSNIKIRFVDLNQDQSIDLAFLGAEENSFKSKVYWLQNLNPPSQSLKFELTQLQEIDISVNADDTFFFDDVDGDGDIDILLGKGSGALELYLNSGALNFSLEHKAFLGIAGSSLARRLAIAVDDLNGDAKKDLITTDSRGYVHIYNDFLNAASPDPERQIYLNRLAAESTDLPVGSDAQVSTVKMAQGKHPYIVIGNKKGGVQLLKSTTLSAPGKEDLLELDVFPNPTDPRVNNGSFFVRINDSATIEIIALTGQVIIGPFQATGLGLIMIETEELNAGVFVVKAISRSGQSSFKRLVVLK